MSMRADPVHCKTVQFDMQGYVEELAVCLVAVEKDTDGKSMERLKRLTTELVRLAHSKCCVAGVTCPSMSDCM